MTPEVAVVIPCRAADDVIVPQLEALEGQVDAPTFKILVADNGANRDLAGLVRRHAPSVPFRVVDATRERGTAHARNVGILMSTVQKLLFCDADDVVGPTWVRDGARVLDDVEAFSGGAVPFTADELAGSLDDVWSLLRARRDDYVASSPGDMPLGTYPVLLGCSFGMRREFAFELRGFDRHFNSQAEDNDLAFRIQERLGTLPRASHVAVAYRVRPSDEVSLRRAFHAGFAHAELCARHDAWLLSPSYRGHWIIRPIRESLRGRGALGHRGDALMRLAGLSAGRLCYTHAALPPARLGMCD